VFFMCGMRRNHFTTIFLDLLWQKLTDPNTPPVIRQSSAAYLASFLSRAKFIGVRLAQIFLSKMCDWGHAYIDKHSSTSDFMWIKLQAHGTFYAVCQAAFYVFIFRYKEFLESRKGFAYCRGLNFSKIVNSPLNPLNACLPNIVDKFALVTKQYQLAYCYSIIERNQRITIPMLSKEFGSNPNNVTMSNHLNTVFPFDPYLLARTSKYITDKWREYSGPGVSERVTDRHSRISISETEEMDFTDQMTGVASLSPVCSESPAISRLSPLTRNAKHLSISNSPFSSMSPG